MLIVEKVCKFLTLVIPTYIINMIYSVLKLNNVFIVPKLKKNSYQHDNSLLMVLVYIFEFDPNSFVIKDKRKKIFMREYDLTNFMHSRINKKKP